MDRRSFLKNSGASVGGFVASPRLGMLGLIGAALGMAADRKGSTTESLPELYSKPFIRTGEPLNSRGVPFGGAVSGLAFVEVPAVLSTLRGVLVVSHAGASGISTLDLVYREKLGWRHDVGGERNRFWNSTTPVPIEGMRFSTGLPAFRHQALTTGVQGIGAIAATPWNTVLMGENAAEDLGGDFGWLVELNPLVGVPVKRLSLGRIHPLKIEVRAVAGESLEIFVLGRKPGAVGLHLFKFITHQRFEARQLDLNRTVLSMGELFVADFKSSQWILVAQGLEGEKWLERMRDPYGFEGLPESQIAENQTFSLVSEAGLGVKILDKHAEAASVSISNSNPKARARLFAEQIVEEGMASLEARPSRIWIEQPSL